MYGEEQEKVEKLPCYHCMYTVGAHAAASSLPCLRTHGLHVAGA